MNGAVYPARRGDLAVLVRTVLDRSVPGAATERTEAAYCPACFDHGPHPATGATALTCRSCAHPFLLDLPDATTRTPPVKEHL